MSLLDSRFAFRSLENSTSTTDMHISNSRVGFGIQQIGRITAHDGADDKITETQPFLQLSHRPAAFYGGYLLYECTVLSSSPLHTLTLAHATTSLTIFA